MFRHFQHRIPKIYKGFGFRDMNDVCRGIKVGACVYNFSNRFDKKREEIEQVYPINAEAIKKSRLLWTFAWKLTVTKKSRPLQRTRAIKAGFFWTFAQKLKVKKTKT